LIQFCDCIHNALKIEAYDNAVDSLLE
jgi:hypothetical protein